MRSAGYAITVPVAELCLVWPSSWDRARSSSLLSRGGCATRWRYRRTQCPFCERDEHRLSGFAIEGSPLRIDYCEACAGHLKTYYSGEADTPLLEDRMSIHLDVAACDKGLNRFAGSLFQL